jgi:hypothetical protein
MNVLSAVISGMLGTFAISAVMAVAPTMGMPKMDIVDMLSTMFGKPNRILGWIMHLMMGVVFALIYAYLWSLGIGSPGWLSGIIFGAAHWLMVGLMMAVIPMMHVGIKNGEVEAPGLWMTNQGGGLAFIGGLMGHIVFGLVVALVQVII